MFSGVDSIFKVSKLEKGREVRKMRLNTQLIKI